MPTAQHTAGRAKLLVFSTGGTIAMQAGEEGVKLRDGADIPGLFSNQNAAFEEIVFSNLPSPHMTLENWLKLAAAIDASLKSPQIAGAVVLHGTDLLPECALTLKLCLSAEKPVVVTGSMRAQGESGYDGLRNLENAAAICLALPGCKNVFACMGDEIFSASTVFKQNSVAPASMSAHDGLLGRVVNKEVIFYRGSLCPRETEGSCQAARLAGPDSLPLFNPRKLLEQGIPKVGLIAALPGDEGLLVDHLLQSGIQGLVVEGFGAGNIPPLLAARLKAALKTGLPVLITTRCPQGGAHPVYAYAGGAKDLQEAGAILCAESTALKAVIFLRLALASRFSKSRIEDFFKQYD